MHLIRTKKDTILNVETGDVYRIEGDSGIVFFKKNTTALALDDAARALWDYLVSLLKFDALATKPDTGEESV